MQEWHLPLELAGNYSPAQLGPYVLKRIQWRRAGLPTPDAVVIFPHAMHWTPGGALIHQHALAVMQIYHRHFSGELVRINGSYPVQGEANVLELLSKYRKVGTAVLIEANTQPQTSGVVWSCHPHTGDKRKMVIAAGFGPYLEHETPIAQDWFELDPTTWEITQRYIEPKTHFYQYQGDGSAVLGTVPSSIQQRPALSDRALSEIAQVIYRYKRTHTHHVKVSWEVVQQHLYITNISLFEPPTEQAEAVRHRWTPVVMGKTLQAGSTSGPIAFPTIKVPPTNAILVTPQADHAILRHAPSLAGLIIEGTTISPTVAQEIRRLGIPCAMGMHRVSQKLRAGETVLLQAKNTGQAAIYHAV